MKTRKSLLRSKCFLSVISLILIIIGYVAWNLIVQSNNSAQIVIKDLDQPIERLPNNVSHGPVFYTLDSVMFKFDTGANYSIISAKDVKRYRVKSQKPVLDISFDVNGQMMARFGKVRIDTISFKNGFNLVDAEFIVGGTKNTIGMDIIHNYVLVFERVNNTLDLINVYLLPSRPAEYSYKLLDIGYKGGYVRDFFSIRPYINFKFNGSSNRYLMDTQGPIFKMPTTDSLRISDGINIWRESPVKGINNSISTKRFMDFEFFCTYKHSGKQCYGHIPGYLVDYVTKYAFNPAALFPFSVAIDFPNNAIYTKEIITDFRLTTDTPY